MSKEFVKKATELINTQNELKHAKRLYADITHEISSNQADLLRLQMAEDKLKNKKK